MPSSEALYTISPSVDSTLALEVFKTGLMRRKKHVLFFERFSGTLSYIAHKPECSRADIVVDANSITCRDPWLNPKQRQQLMQYCKQEALVSDGHQQICFCSRRISAKPLRGFEVEGELKVCDVGRIVKVNVVLSERKHDIFQIDGDTTVRLSDFGIKPPSSMFGLIGTRDEALVRILLWARPVGASSAAGQSY
jgi:polyisoprenoid-binding protein YceI